MRFTCRSTESLIIQDELRAKRAQEHTNAVASTSKAAKGKGKAKASSKRVSHAAREVKVHQAAQAAKRKKKSTRAATAASSTRASKPGYSFVYVGNLQPGITQAQLGELFKSCGDIGRVSIRCSGGQAFTGVIPEAARGPRDNQYATIEFRNADGALEAVTRMDGHMVNGYTKPLVVSYFAGDLPEIKAIVDQVAAKEKLRVAQQEARRKGHAQQATTRTRTTKPLQAAATERLIERGKSGADKIRIFGFSFATSVI